MGRLDMHIKDVYVKNELVDEDLVDELDDLEPIEGLPEVDEPEMPGSGLRKVLYPYVLKKSARRKLEERLEDFRLQHQINDYDFKI